MGALNKRALTFVQGGLIVANPNLSLWGGGRRSGVQSSPSATKKKVLAFHFEKSKRCKVKASGWGLLRE